METAATTLEQLSRVSRDLAPRAPLLILVQTSEVMALCTGPDRLLRIETMETQRMATAEAARET